MTLSIQPFDQLPEIKKHFFKIFQNIFKAFALETLENLKRTFLQYYMHSDVCS